MSHRAISLDANEMADIQQYFDLMIKESKKNVLKKEDKLLNLLDCIHIEISRKYISENKHTTHSYNYKIQQLAHYLEQHYKTEKKPSFYASKMNITLKHLNRICKETLDQTATEVITQRIILESKRLLINPKNSINQIAVQLGFENCSYFTRLFKKQTNSTPTAFRNDIR